MKGAYLGEFQEIVLLSILVLDNESYGVKIQKEIAARSGRSISRGGLHSALMRLEEKGFLSSRLGGATKARGGRNKKYYSLTNAGKEALREAQQIRDRFQEGLIHLKPEINS